MSLDTWEFPRDLEHPYVRLMLTAAHLLEYHAKADNTPAYTGIIEGLRKAAKDVYEHARPKLS